MHYIIFHIYISNIIYLTWNYQHTFAVIIIFFEKTSIDYFPKFDSITIF